ncbi:hypothetical protein CDCA_CDCA06G1970 [Cyanidium caldarium]|uniref:Nuclear transcription factor Y subunit n=1 Tax=Cyanidium caldarium TaxID=2771 RepID=A0AAV9IV29_CYACA|nr:hypothetical protein CDCA_CDCA06G1970 [Cyanidium caldarium]
MSEAGASSRERCFAISERDEQRQVLVTPSPLLAPLRGSSYTSWGSPLPVPRPWWNAAREWRVPVQPQPLQAVPLRISSPLVSPLPRRSHSCGSLTMPPPRSDAAPPESWPQAQGRLPPLSELQRLIAERKATRTLSAASSWSPLAAERIWLPPPPWRASKGRYANARQYHRIVKRREQRFREMRRMSHATEVTPWADSSAKRAANADATSTQSESATVASRPNRMHPRKPRRFRHPSRRAHAMRRPRAPNGRFLSRREYVRGSGIPSGPTAEVQSQVSSRLGPPSATSGGTATRVSDLESSTTRTSESDDSAGAGKNS